MPDSVFDDLGLKDDMNIGSVDGSPAVWTLLGEAGTDPEGQFRVASTIHNRATEAKSDYDKIVTDPKQGYEAWQDTDARAKAQKSYPVGSPEYKAASDLLDNLKAGKTAPSADYYFYSPTGQVAKGRPAPEFEDNQTGVDAGGNRFFQKKASGDVFDELGLNSSGGLSPDTPIIQNPLPEPPSAPGNAMSQARDRERGNQAADIGFEQGLANVRNSIETVPALVSPEVRANLQSNLAQRRQNDLTYGGNSLYAPGKSLGEFAASAPIFAIPGVDTALAGTRFAPAAEFLAGNFGKGLVARGASLATQGALQGTEAAALTSAGTDKPLAGQLEQGVITGAVAAPVLHAVGSGLSNLIHPTAPAPVADLADTAINKFGIKLKAAPSQNVEQQSQWVKSIGNEFGVPSEDVEHGISPEVMSAAKDRIGKQMNDIKARNSIGDVDSLRTNMGNVINDANLNLAPEQVAPLLKHVENISSKINDGVIPGTAFHALTAENSPLTKLGNDFTNPASFYARELKAKLNSAFDNSVNPEDKTAWAAAKTKYKNMMTVADAIGPNGAITPDALYKAVEKNFSGSAFGSGNLGKLADIGQIFMNSKPEKNPLLSHLGTIGIGSSGPISASVLYSVTHNPQLALEAGAAGIGAAGLNMTKNAFLHSRSLYPTKPVRPVFDYLSGKWATPATTIGAQNMFQGTK